MIDKAEREQIIALINREVVPAIGCTEPIAVALCAAKASETLGACPEKIEVLLSANILKNAHGGRYSGHRHDRLTHCHRTGCSDR